MEGKKTTCTRSSEGRVELNKDTPWLHHPTENASSPDPGPRESLQGVGLSGNRSRGREISSAVAAIRDACLQVSAPRGQGYRSSTGRTLPEMERLEDELGI